MGDVPTAIRLTPSCVDGEPRAVHYTYMSLGQKSDKHGSVEADLETPANTVNMNEPQGAGASGEAPSSSSAAAAGASTSPATSPRTERSTSAFPGERSGQRSAHITAQKLQYGNECFVLHEVFGATSKANHDDSIGNSDCIICLSEPRDTAVLPCRHMCFCRHCASIVRLQCEKCPVCRQKVASLLQFTPGEDPSKAVKEGREESAGATASASSCGPDDKKPAASSASAAAAASISAAAAVAAESEVAAAAEGCEQPVAAAAETAAVSPSQPPRGGNSTGTGGRKPYRHNLA